MPNKICRAKSPGYGNMVIGGSEFSGAKEKHDGLSEATVYTLHWEYMAGSIVVQAMLEEVGADYRLRYVDMGAGEHQQPKYLRINPAARVPALGLPDGTIIGETAAIVVALGEHFPRLRLTPQPGDQDRAAFLFWLNVMATSGYLTVARAGHPERYAVEADAIRQVEAKAWADLDAFFDVMEGAISSDTFFLAEGFTAIDIYLAMLTEWSKDKNVLFSTRPALMALCRVVTQRPAYLTAMNTHLLPQHAA
jgi:glutathione S-transferase